MASPRGSALEAFPATHAVRRRLAQDHATAAGALRASTDVRRSGHRSPHSLHSWLLRACRPSSRSARVERTGAVPRRRSLPPRTPARLSLCSRRPGPRSPLFGPVTERGAPLNTLANWGICKMPRASGALGRKGSQGGRSPEATSPGAPPQAPRRAPAEPPPKSPCRPELRTASEQVSTTPRARSVVPVVVGISPGGTSSSAAATICK